MPVMADHLFNASVGIDNGFEGSGLPKMSSAIAFPRDCARNVASTASEMPFGQIIRATTATLSGGAGGSSTIG